MTDQQEPPISDPVQEAREAVFAHFDEWFLAQQLGVNCPDPLLSINALIEVARAQSQQEERDRVAALIEAAVMEVCKRGTSQSFDEGVHAVQFALAAAMREVRRD